MRISETFFISPPDDVRQMLNLDHETVLRLRKAVYGLVNDETFDRIMTAVRKEFDVGAWDVGNFRFKGPQISQMPNGKIVFDMEQFKHELEQIDVSQGRQNQA